MNKPLCLALLGCSLAIPMSGCKDDVETIEPEKPSVVFEGVPDAKFEGTWKTEDGVSTYNIVKDGTYKLESKFKVHGPNPMISHLTGQWAVKGDKMLFKDQSNNVSAYLFDLQGSKLTLTTVGVMKGKTIMDRQP